MLSLWGVAGARALAVEVRGVPPVCWEEELLLQKLEIQLSTVIICIGTQSNKTSLQTPLQMMYTIVLLTHTNTHIHIFQIGRAHV